ncbi:MAG: anhydro-N-acetylmuramic acid kinase [Pseudomonadota bacterium]
MAQEDALWATGAMSGTSLDGVDWATVLTDGIDILEFGASGYRPYTSQEQSVLRTALGSWPNEGSNILAPAFDIVMNSHREALLNAQDELVGFHGQTLNHDPATKRSFQLGDGAKLAQALQRPVVWDFRSADVAAGGQGAPLAPFYHHALARWAKLEGPVAFLNLGGVGNITWIEDPITVPENVGNLVAFDTGPANAPINDLMALFFQKPFDAGGAVAAKGKIMDTYVHDLLAHPYFDRPSPKSLDRNAFESSLLALTSLRPEDAVATATAWVSASVKIGMDRLPKRPKQVLVCGGGRQNPQIMAQLSQALETVVAPIESIGIDGDMLEAQAFGYLAVRTLKGLPLSAPGTTGVARPLIGGQISRP